MVIIGFGVVAIFAGLLIWNVTKRAAANKQLRLQKSELEEQHQALEQARGEIEVMNKRLQAANVNLEQIVDTRTEELRRANSDLVQANENLDLFIYRASHDLRGPIARLKGLAQIARLESAQTGAGN